MVKRRERWLSVIPILYSSYITLVLYSTLVWQMVGIIRHTEIVGCSSTVQMVSSPSSAYIHQLSSLASGAGCPTPASVGDSS